MVTKIPETGVLPVKNTAWRRWLTLLASKTTARFYKYNGACGPLAPGVMLKMRYSENLTEAATLGFIANHTSIPVPRVYCSFVRKGKTYTVMERIRGKTIAAAIPDLSDSEFEDVLMQLRTMVQELRALPAADCAIKSCVGGSLYDYRIPRQPRFGPFPSIREFHYWLRDGFRLDQCHLVVDESDKAGIERMIEMQDSFEPTPPVFTHGDLNPFNVLVRDGKIVAIIDWEFAGWLPDYWEYACVWQSNKTRQFWQHLAHKFIDPCSDAILEMEAVRQRWWGDF
ncbi:hypothetical protein E4U41_005571 [Claviceps citrina]|nr:hypothetical protein E4U41_005571 [Claviceps citrina]